MIDVGVLHSLFIWMNICPSGFSALGVHTVSLFGVTNYNHASGSRTRFGNASGVGAEITLGLSRTHHNDQDNVSSYSQDCLYSLKFHFAEEVGNIITASVLWLTYVTGE